MGNGDSMLPVDKLQRTSVISDSTKNGNIQDTNYGSKTWTLTRNTKGLKKDTTCP